MTRWIFHPIVSLVVRVTLAIVLLAACRHKIADPPDFANVLYHYKLFPEIAINLLAIYVPWLEVALAGALICGCGRRGAGFIGMVLFLSFILALGYNLLRGCPTVCGCFDTYAAGEGMTDLEKFEDMRREIRIDVGCFLLSLHVFLSSFVRRQGRGARRAAGEGATEAPAAA